MVLLLVPVVDSFPQFTYLRIPLCDADPPSPFHLRSCQDTGGTFQKDKSTSGHFLQACTQGSAGQERSLGSSVDTPSDWSTSRSHIRAPLILFFMIIVLVMYVHLRAHACATTMYVCTLPHFLQIYMFCCRTLFRTFTLCFGCQTCFYRVSLNWWYQQPAVMQRDRIREGSILRRRNRGEIPRALSPHYRRPGPRYGGIPEYRRR